MRVLILSTMLTDRRGTGEWGFSALIEAGGRRLLLDAGGRPDTVLRNAEELGEDLSSIEEIVLSHGHWDHTGGLVALRRALRPRNEAAVTRAHVGPGFFAERRRGGKLFSLSLEARREYEALGGVFVEHAAPAELAPGVWITGPIARPNAELSLPRDIWVETPAGPRGDDVPEDCAVVLDEGTELVVVTGCGHAGVVNTIAAARATVGDKPVGAVLGGLHLFEADDAKLDWTGAQLRGAGVRQVLGAHCTGIEAVFRLRASAGLDRRTCVIGSVGSQYETGRGITTGLLAR